MIPPLLPVVQRPDAGPCVPFVGPHLYLGLAVETASARRSVTEEELLSWDEPFQRLCDHAILRLRGALQSNELHPIDTLPGVWCLTTTDGLAASRMLCLGDLVRPWPLEGVVIAATSPNELLIVPLEGMDGLIALPGLLRALTVAASPVSDQVFWCDADGAWSHLPTRYTAQGVHIDPPQRFIGALERAASLDLVPCAGEA